MTQIAYSAFLALRAMVRNPLPVFVSALGLAAVLAPLLILYGLKSGILNGMITELRSDPAVLSVLVIGNKPLTEADISELDAMDSVGFIVGAPRSISTRVEMSDLAAFGNLIVADWLPSAVGDPLLPDGAPALTTDEIVLSQTLAQRLGLVSGDTVHSFAYRNNESEVYAVALTIVDVLPKRRLSGSRALVASALLNSVAAFSDNYEVPDLGIAGKPLVGRVAKYDSLRLYANSLDDVVILDKAMVERGFRAESKSGSIAWIRTLDAVMTGVFAIISTAGALGCFISLGANVASTVAMQRHELSLLRLLGISATGISIFPLVQVLTMATLGLITTFIAAISVAYVINGLYLQGVFASNICSISIELLAATAVITYLMAAIIVLWQIYLLRNIAPTEVLADNV